MCEFYFHYNRCCGIDFLWSNNWSDSIWKCTVNFLSVSLEIKIEPSVKYGMYKRHNKCDYFEDKGKYSMFGTSCQRFWIHITKILVSHIHKNTIMSDKHIVILQSSMQFLPTRLPIIILQRVEEQFPASRKIMLSAVCRQKNSVILFQGFVWPKEQNVL